MDIPSSFAHSFTAPTRSLWLIALAFVGFLIAMPGGLSAQSGISKERTGKPTVIERSVYVPFSRLEEVLGRMDRAVILPYEEFQRLWRDRSPIDGKPEEPRHTAVITDGELTGSVTDNMAELRLSLTVVSLTDETTLIPLNLQEAVVTEVVDDTSAVLVSPSSTGGYDLVVSKKGTHALTLGLRMQVGSAEGLRNLVLSIPRATSLRLSLTLPEPDLDAVVSGAPIASVESVEGTTRVRAFCGGSTSVGITWNDRPTELSATSGHLTSSQDLQVLIGSLSTQIRATLSYELAQAATQTLEIRLPEPFGVLNVECPNLQRWEMTAIDGDRTLRLILDRPVRGAFRVSLNLETAVLPSENGEAPRTTLRSVPSLATRFARLETGRVSVTVNDELTASVATASFVTRTDPRHRFLPANNPEARQVLPHARFAYRFLRSDYTLEFAVGPVKSKIRVNTSSHFTIDDQGVTLYTKMVYDVREAGVFELRVRVPAVWDLDRNAEDTRIRDVIASDEDGELRVLRLLLRAPMRGSFSLPLSFRQPRTPTGHLSLQSIRPIDVLSFRGTVTVGAATHFELSVDSASGLVPIDIRSIDAGERAQQEVPLVLGFRADRDDFELGLQVEKRRPKVTCQTMAVIRYEEDRVEFVQFLDYSILYARIGSFRLLVPAELSESIRFESPAIREAVRIGQLTLTGPIPSGSKLPIEWRIDLQSPAEGPLRLVATAELRHHLQAGDKALDFPLLTVSPLDIEREIGYLVLKKTANLEIDTERRSVTLEPIDPKELPPAFLMPDAFQAFRFHSRPISATARVALNEVEEVLSAVAEQMHVETVVAESGKARSLCIVELRRTELANLELALPEGSSILTASVDGKSTRPTRRDDGGNIRVALPTDRNPSQKTILRLLYEQNRIAVGGAAKSSGSIRLLSPSLFDPTLHREIPVLRLSWRIFIPDRNHVLEFGGNMRPVADPTHWSTMPWLPSFLSTYPSSPKAQRVPTQSLIQAEVDRMTREAEAQSSGGYALNVNLVREGKSYTFYRLEGPGKIVLSYVSPALFGILRLICLLLAPTSLIYLASKKRYPKLPVALGFFVVLLIALPFVGAEVARLLDTALFAGALVIATWAATDFILRFKVASDAARRKKERARETRESEAAVPSTLPAPEEEKGTERDASPEPDASTEPDATPEPDASPESDSGPPQDEPPATDPPQSPTHDESPQEESKTHPPAKPKKKSNKKKRTRRRKGGGGR